MSTLKDNTGTLHLVRDKDKKKETSPDYRGTFLIDGRKYEAVAWRSKRFNTDNQPFLQIKLTPVISTEPGYDPLKP